MTKIAISKWSLSHAMVLLNACTSESVSSCLILMCLREIVLHCSPLHVCAAASKGRCENLEPSEPLIECRRCPVAYHEECIPLALLATRSKPNGKRVWLAKSEHRRGNALTDEAGRRSKLCQAQAQGCIESSR